MAGFQRATAGGNLLRMALLGPSGSGKTYSALAIMSHLVDRIGLIDTEHHSASKYADHFTFDTLILGEDTPEARRDGLHNFSPSAYIKALQLAAQAGYPGVIIDSGTHAWAGKDGVLEYVDNYAKRNRGDSHGAWREATPLHNELVESMLSYPGHLIVTMRVKMEYSRETDPKTGKTIIRKIGLQPVQREGMEYEFDVIGDVDMEHTLTISKTRCFLLTDKIFHRAGKDVADILRPWLAGMVAQPAPAAAPPRPPQAAPKPAAPAPAPANGGNGNGGGKAKPSAVMTPEQQATYQEITALSRTITDAEGNLYFDSAKWKAFLTQCVGGESLTGVNPARFQQVLDELHELQTALRAPQAAGDDPLADVADPFAGEEAGAEPESAADIAGAQIERIGELVAEAGLSDANGNWLPDMFRVIAHIGLKRKKLVDYTTEERQTLIDNLAAACADPEAMTELLRSRKEPAPEPAAVGAPADGPGF